MKFRGEIIAVLKRECPALYNVIMRHRGGRIAISNYEMEKIVGYISKLKGIEDVRSRNRRTATENMG